MYISIQVRKKMLESNTDTNRRKFVVRSAPLSIDDIDDESNDNIYNDQNTHELISRIHNRNKNLDSTLQDDSFMHKPIDAMDDASIEEKYDDDDDVIIDNNII